MDRMWIRIGKRGQDYYDYARPISVRAVVYSDAGVTTYEKKLSDSYSVQVEGFQDIYFGEELTGVTTIELYVPVIKVGDVYSYKVMLGDLAFTSQLP